MIIRKSGRYKWPFVLAGSVLFLHQPAIAFPLKDNPATTPAVISADASQADKSEKARHFIQAMGDEVISYISDSSKSPTEERQKLQEVLNKNFDLNTISRFALGHYWNSLNSKQQSEYRKLYEEKIVSIYADKFSNYTGQDFKVGSVQKSGAGDYSVLSEITTPEGKNIPVSWQIREKNADLKVIDVAIDGVSMILTQKSDFSSAIQRNGGNPEVILDYLRQ